ncbi:hypothetical protein Tco_1321965 [Tanacetum coccineum]
MELRLQKGSIKATRQKVHEMLGIPMRSKKLEDLELRPSNDPFTTRVRRTQLSLRQTKPSAMPEYITYDTKVGGPVAPMRRLIGLVGLFFATLHVIVPMEIVDIMGEVEVQNEENMNEKESDKEKVNENERNVETEKEKQAEIEKAIENQGNNDQRYDHLTQDEFWENEFNEETFDKVLNEAAKSFKQRKDLTRSKRNSMTPLTFSLGPRCPRKESIQSTMINL